jgi:glycosyltransferase involved in cell wall biosynthesis
MEKSLISIIIPSYNRAHLISETLDSIIVQTYTNWECIIVDDGSKDNTKEILSEYCKRDNRFQYHQRPKNRIKGGSAARNYGFALSKGEYINWFDSDDIMLPNFLKEKIKIFNIESDLDVVFSYGAYFEKNEKELKVSKPKLESLTILDYVKNNFYLITHGPLWKREFLNDKILFDENRLKLQDTEFHFRMLLKQPKVKFYETNYLFLLRRGNQRISSKENLTSKKIQDVFDYHYSTLICLNSICESNKKEYLNVTLFKTFANLYDSIIFEKDILSRFKLLITNCSKIDNAMIISNKTFFQRNKMYLGIFTAIFIKKGFKLITS